MGQMNDDNFQITLPSNASKTVFPKNKPNSYKTKLCKTIDLPGSAEDWEVALVDIQFPPNWPNVLNDSWLAFILEHPEGQRTPDNSPPMPPGRELGAFDTSLLYGTYGDVYYSNEYHIHTKIHIPSGHYRSIVELGQLIVSRFNQMAKGIKTMEHFSIDFTYDTGSRIARFVNTTPAPGGRIHFAATTSSLMESIFPLTLTYSSAALFTSTEVNAPPLFSYKLPLESQRPCSLEYLSSLYVYSDLARYQLIGDTQAPLLGIVPIQGSDDDNRYFSGDQQYYAFNPAYYIPLVRNSFDIIELEFKTDWDHPFPFADDANSRVVCRLNFRKRKNTSTGGRIFL